MFFCFCFCSQFWCVFFLFCFCSQFCSDKWGHNKKNYACLLDVVEGKVLSQQNGLGSGTKYRTLVCVRERECTWQESVCKRVSTWQRSQCVCKREREKSTWQRVVYVWPPIGCLDIWFSFKTFSWPRLKFQMPGISYFHIIKPGRKKQQDLEFVLFAICIVI